MHSSGGDLLNYSIRVFKIGGDLLNYRIRVFKIAGFCWDTSLPYYTIILAWAKLESD